MDFGGLGLAWTLRSRNSGRTTSAIPKSSPEPEVHALSGLRGGIAARHALELGSIASNAATRAPRRPQGPILAERSPHRQNPCRRPSCWLPSYTGSNRKYSSTLSRAHHCRFSALFLVRETGNLTSTI